MTQMAKFLGIATLSMLFAGGLSVPFINLLYRLRFYKTKKVSDKKLADKRNPLYYNYHGAKLGTPAGGGILIIGSVILFSLLFYALTKFSVNWTTVVLFLTLISFGALGFYDDWRKFFGYPKTGFWGIRPLVKLALQGALALAIAWLLYRYLDLHSVRLPLACSLSNFCWLDLGVFYIPFSALVIVSASNAFNITDGLDGLATGLLLIALFPFWYLAGESPFGGDVSLFIAVIFGALLAFLYFNIHPARLFMGDTGALALGAMLGVIALVVGNPLSLILVGGVFVGEALSSALQLLSLRLRKGRGIFLIAPFHHHLQARGWGETKVTMRLWLAGVVFAIVGLLVALL